MTAVSHSRLETAFRTARDYLLAARHPDGYWEGRLSSSALSTATAISALALAEQAEDAALLRAGARWLVATQNADGGWGDTIDSPSNLATTLLVAAALKLAKHPSANDTLIRAGHYLSKLAGDTPAERVTAITAAYGKDRTFAVPILLNCALAGLAPWEAIPGLPFELAVFPHAMYKALRLHVVSYALPALIAVGLLLHRRHPTRNPLHHLVRELVVNRVMAKLAAIQPDSGGFLEATPLTSFVAMSLLPLYAPAHPVIHRCLRFLRQSMRADGSWPIDTNLSVWMTSSAVTALASAGEFSGVDAECTTRWLSAQQYQIVHPYTNAAPGGWGWTHLSGGVPDADDTSGAIIALTRLGERAAPLAGVYWLLQLQNRDGGWPTFCQGWGSLPFDKSSPDITAHALRALQAVAPGNYAVVRRRGLQFLHATQREDGAWVPLWFGNQQVPGKYNPVLGTARVLLAYADLQQNGEEARRGVQYLINAQQADGCWGGDRGMPASVEETALAVIALRCWQQLPDVESAYQRGIAYLVRRVEDNSWRQPAPIGLYFASLWYSEEFYPIIWTVEALGSVVQDSCIKE